MRLNSEGLRELYQRETARSSRQENDCLAEDLLARAAAGDLSQAERERTADHLATCSDCTKEYRAISSLKTWAEGISEESGVSSPNGDRRPIRLASSYKRQQGPIAVEHKFQGPGVISRPFSFYLPYAIAAALLVVSLALGALLVSKSRENQRLIAQAESTRNAGAIQTAESLDESRRLLEETTRRADQESAARRLAEEELARRDAAAKPSSRTRQNPVLGRHRTEDQFSAAEVNVPIFDLDPQDGGRGEQRDEATTIRLPPDANLFTLILNLGGGQSSGGYSLEVLDRHNKTVWVGRGLRKSAYNNFTVSMRRRSFPAGEYLLKLYGLRDGRRELIEAYAIRLTYR
jgi:hypothetical protein